MKNTTRRTFLAVAALAAVMTLSVAGLEARPWGGPGNGGDCPRYSRGGNGAGYGRHHRGHRRGGRMYFLKEELKLSDAQVEKIFDINNEFRKKAFKLREKASYETMGKLHDSRMKAIENVLNSTQKKKFKELHENRPGRRGYGSGPGYGRGWR